MTMVGGHQTGRADAAMNRGFADGARGTGQREARRWFGPTLGGALLALMWTPIACGTDRLASPATTAIGGADAGSDGAGASMTVAAACAQLSVSLCTPLGTCCDVATLRYVDSADCQKRVAADCVAASVDVADAVSDGLAVVDLPRLQACLAALDAAGHSCLAVDGPGMKAACWPVFRDRAARGAVCKSGVVGMRCGDGVDICVFGDGTGGRALRCQAAPGIGASCSVSECAAGLRCVGPTTAKTCQPPGDLTADCEGDADCTAGLRCHGGSCTSPVANGGACGATEPCGALSTCLAGVCDAAKDKGASCADDDDCLDGLFCAEALAGVCGGLGPAGAPCKGHASCLPGLACDPKLNSCVARPPIGSSCVAGACQGGAGCDHGPGSGRDDDGKCAPLPGEASPCLVSETPCDGGLACADGKVCGPPLAKGAACTHPAACQAGLVCHPEQKVCAAPPTASGQPCLHGQCGEGLYCSGGEAGSQGVCQAQLAIGDDCPSGAGCGPGLTCLQVDSLQARCIKLPSAGAVCSFACAPGLTCKTSIGKGTCKRRLCLHHAG